MSYWAKLKAVTFVAPPITIYQADHILRWLGKSTNSGLLSTEFNKLRDKLQTYDLGYINLVQSELLLYWVTDEAYEYRNDRVLAWLHELVIETGRALCSPIAAELAANSKLIHDLDNQHAEYRNKIETLRLRVQIRFAIRKLGHDDTRFNEEVEGCIFSTNSPVPMCFDDRRFYASTEVVAKELVKYSGGKHE
jgi:hypothetical protein